MLRRQEYEMEQRPIRITVPGIRKALNSYKLERAISEFIWNGFDAGATVVNVEYDSNGLGGIEELRISDNGTGIDFDALDKTFRPFFESSREFQLAASRKISAIHGKNGVGRLTFFRFARTAQWETVYGSNGESPRGYSISVNVDSLNTFQSTTPQLCDAPLGTTVRFTGVVPMDTYLFENSIVPYFRQQFAWFLELNGPRGFKILVNDSCLDYGSLIGERDSKNWQIPDDAQTFQFAMRYVQWLRKPADEFSHFYYVGSDNVERHKKTTTFNKKSDEFYHSVYITSSFFDSIGQTEWPEAEYDDGQMSLFSRRNPVYKALHYKLSSFLRDKRKPFLKRYTDRLVESYHKDGVFPVLQSRWEEPRLEELERLVRDLYVVKPSLFSDLNLEQRKTFVRLLNLALDESERDSLLAIIREVVDLDSSERKELAERFKYSSLSNISKTIRLIEDRYKAVAEFKQLIYELKEFTYENDVQKMVEQHYWLFGEGYSLVTAAEPNFEQALRRQRFLLYGDDSIAKINHPDKDREMDIFAVRQTMHNGRINNIVVELKRPKVYLAREHLDQVEEYMDVIRSTGEFNAANMTWQYYLIGNDFKKKDRSIIEGKIESAKNHGEAYLVQSLEDKRIRVYVKKWSEVFGDFELRHSFLQEKLELEREKLISQGCTPSEIVSSQSGNTATSPPEAKDPSNPN